MGELNGKIGERVRRSEVEEISSRRGEVEELLSRRGEVEELLSRRGEVEERRGRGFMCHSSWLGWLGIASPLSRTNVTQNPNAPHLPSHNDTKTARPFVNVATATVVDAAAAIRRIYIAASISRFIVATTSI